MEPQLLDAPPAAWTDLLAIDPSASPAHRPALWNAFAATFGMRPMFVAARAAGQLEGGAPVLIQRRGGFHWLLALPMLLPGAPLARPGRHAEVDEAVARGLGALQRELRAIGGAWTLYRPVGAAPTDGVLAACDGETRFLESAWIDVSAGLDAPLRRVDRKTRQDLRRASRRLRFEEAPSHLGDAYALYVRQARAWSAHRPLPIELARRLLSESEPAARLFTVRDGRGLLSAVLALDHARETMLWWSGSHPDARAAHAFPFLLWSVVEWAQRAGRARVNLGASAGKDPIADFKASLGAAVHRYPVRWLSARHAGPAGRWVAAWQARARRGRDRGATV